MSKIEIRGSGASWQCYLDGRPVDTPTNAYEKACTKALKLERDLQKQDRLCLGCDVSFTAAHRHNRLCPGCTDFAAGAMV